MTSAVLIINRNDSLCGRCKRGADPSEKAHTTALGYFSREILDDPYHPARIGCGAVFSAVSSGYSGMEKRVQEMRPDLPLLA